MHRSAARINWPAYRKTETAFRNQYMWRWKPLVAPNLLTATEEVIGALDSSVLHAEETGGLGAADVDVGGS